MKFNIGDRVTHSTYPEYGVGTIVSINNNIGCYGVCFDGWNHRLHDLEGMCARNHGWWVTFDSARLEFADEDMDVTFDISLADLFCERR